LSEVVQITSVKNPIVRRFRDAAAGEVGSAMVIDGAVLVGDALAAGVELREVATSPRLVATDRGRELRRQLIAAGVASTDCSDAVLERISHLTTHQGVAALASRPRFSDAELLGSRALVVVAAGVRDPGNLGALIRTAEAAGATGVVALKGGADPYREKAVRGSAGSVFRVPVKAGVAPAELLTMLRDAGARVVVADATGSRSYLDVDLRGAVALVVGGEAGGVPDALIEAADERVHVPMAGSVESLNVAVAAGVVMFEAVRQRR